jgi:hypothetical protein
MVFVLVPHEGRCMFDIAGSSSRQPTSFHGGGWRVANRAQQSTLLVPNSAGKFLG